MLSPCAECTSFYSSCVIHSMILRSWMVMWLGCQSGQLFVDGTVDDYLVFASEYLGFHRCVVEPDLVFLVLQLSRQSSRS